VTEGSAQVNFKCPSKLLADFDEAWRYIPSISNRTVALLRVMENFVLEYREAREV